MYIAIEGVIGVGKTTLARLLQPAFQSELLLEVFEENPFLSDFYSDRARYAFQTQIFFLLSRYHQQRHGVVELLKQHEHLFADYTFEKDALFAGINLHGDELDMYYRVHEALAEKIIPPHLVVYLKADTEVPPGAMVIDAGSKALLTTSTWANWPGITAAALKVIGEPLTPGEEAVTRVLPAAVPRIRRTDAIPAASVVEVVALSVPPPCTTAQVTVRPGSGVLPVIATRSGSSCVPGTACWLSPLGDASVIVGEPPSGPEPPSPPPQAQRPAPRPLPADANAPWASLVQDLAKTRPEGDASELSSRTEGRRGLPRRVGPRGSGRLERRGKPRLVELVAAALPEHRAGNKPAAPINIAVRTDTLCHLQLIAAKLGRKLRWDPEKEQFLKDDAANAMLDRPMRGPWKL